jgi:hypothetical protein
MTEFVDLRNDMYVRICRYICVSTVLGNFRFQKGSVIKVQEHIQFQVGTEIAFYEKCSDTGVTLSPSLQQPLALKPNGKPNLCKL